ncbi:MAG TPA: hypothetical protein VGA02_10135, partial [Gemmatimonadales bacterium]
MPHHSRTPHPGPYLLVLIGLASSLGTPLDAQQAPVPVTVDDRGVLRWTTTGPEVALWGVNYSTPFAYAYRAHG